MNVLVIAAHPDDEVLGCGGTIPRLVREGHDVYVTILGEGITSRYQDRNEADKAELEALQLKSKQASKLLGVSELLTYDLPDNRFDTIPLLNVVKILEDLISKLQPKVVYTQHAGDVNIDHTVTFRATLAATRPTASCSVASLYAYEVPSSTDWAFRSIEPAFTPNSFVDIAGTLELKIQAMQTYESEARAFPHPRSPESLTANAIRWGAVSGLERAEAFELIRDIR